MTVSTEVRDKFAKDLATVDWKDLRFHLQKDAIILVAADLDLVDVAVEVAADNKHRVSAWISAGQLHKPSREQIDRWETRLDTPFRMLIAQPYILAQPVTHA